MHLSLLLLFALQAPRIGLIEFYGLRHVSEKHVRAALGVREGDALPRSKADIEDRVEHVPGVVSARVEAVCCQGNAAVLYVGVEEKGEPHVDFKAEPEGEIALPKPLLTAYKDFLAALSVAARTGPVEENLAQGHELSTDPFSRHLQTGFVPLAQDNLPILRQVLAEAADPFERAAAAYLIGYYPDKSQVVPDLQNALRDPDPDVRANAIRALTAIAVVEPRVEPTWFIELLNSLDRSDRVRAATALVSLTEKRPPFAMDQIRERARNSLVDMARWKSLPDSLPAFILLGRLAGVSEEAIQQAWTGDREALIQKALHRKRAGDSESPAR